MKKILVWKTKHEDLYYDASTKQKELDAFLSIFQGMEGSGDYECCPPEGKLQKASYRRAKKGDKTAAKDFLLMRCDYEYEQISIENVQDTNSNSNL
ncbi:MAG: hypothetical protein V3U54_08660 [Thermodesulfobacteriota bacterium]